MRRLRPTDDGAVTMLVPEGEPVVGVYRAVEESEFVDLVLQSADKPQGRPQIVAVDGRGAAGKSALATRLQQAVPASAVIHTDDLAWCEPYFAWGHLLLQVLQLLHRGEAVNLRPPAWPANGRSGAIEVAADLELVVVEGVGASQREHAEFIDTTVWVQSDFAEAERRGIARDIEQGVNGDREQSVAFWHEWMSHELSFIQQQQPWQRAAIVVAGTPAVPLQAGQLAIASGPL